MNTPKIGDTINNDKAIDLCKHFGFEHLAECIESNPEQYKDWVFDGASMLPDELVKKALDIPNLTEIALKHDLKYAYGEPGNHIEKRKADNEFEEDLLADGASPVIARTMYLAVNHFGGDEWKTTFSWGFAHI